MAALADEALTAYQKREEQRRAEREEQEAERAEREERARNEAMGLARLAFVDRLGMSTTQADELAHLDHGRTSGPGKRVVREVVVSVPVEGLPEHAIVLVVNWPNGELGGPQIAVAERRGVTPLAVARGLPRIESLADLGQLIVDRQEAYEENTADEPA